MFWYFDKPIWEEGSESKEVIEEQAMKTQDGEGQGSGLLLHQDILGKRSTC